MIDVVLIADNGPLSFSGSNPLRLTHEGRLATIQEVQTLLSSPGKCDDVVSRPTWASAYKLNGIALAAHLESSGFCTCLINNFSADRHRFTAAVAEGAKAIAVSTTFLPNTKELLGLLRQLREECPEVPIIVGGPFLLTSWQVYQKRSLDNYSDPRIAQDYLFFSECEGLIDLAILSERGEDTLCQALTMIKTGQEPHGLPNTAWQEDRTWLFNKCPETSQGLLPINWGKVPDDVFSSGVVPLQASIGCPYHCAYCNFVKDRNNFALKGLAELVAEMRILQARGARYVWFVDDIFRLGKRDLAKAAKAMIDAGLNLQWMSFIRADTVVGVDFDLLKKSGCYELQLGIESASPAVLEAMNKDVTPEIYEKVLRGALAAGINCTVYLIAGHPGETEDSFAETVRFMQRFDALDVAGVISWSIYPFYFVPLSPLFDGPQRKNYQIEGYGLEWQHATLDHRKARDLIKTFFMAMETAGPIYREDDLDLLRSLPPKARRRFLATRHRLAKAASAGQKLTYEDMTEAMTPVFSALPAADPVPFEMDGV